MRAGKILAGAGLIVLPFIFSVRGEQMRVPKARFLVLLAALYLAQLLWRKVHPSLGCATALLALSALFRAATMPWEELIVFLAAMSSCLWVSRLCENDREQGFKLLELSGLICAFYGAVLQYQGADPLLRAIPGHTLANPPIFFGQHTLYGPFAVACFASALFHRRHFVALLLVIPIFLISSSFTFLSLGVVLFLWTWRRFGKRAILGAMAVGLAFGVYSKMRPYSDELNDNGRFRVWRLVTALSEERWVLGHGAGSFRVIFPILQSKELRAANGIKPDEMQTQKARDWFRDADFVRDQWGIFYHPHSEPLSVYYEFGVIGLLIALWWVAAGLWLCFRPWVDLLPGEDADDQHWALSAILLLSLANGLGNFNFHLIPQALLPLWAFTAMTTRKEEGILEA